MAPRTIRILTAVAAFDGHDASVLALNRALLAAGVPLEVIYLGFNMTGEKIAQAALQEGADAVAVSSYNGGHLQFFPHLARRLRELGLANTLLFGGGGGTILPGDAATLEKEGVEKIYGPGWPLSEIARDLIGRTVKHREAAEKEITEDGLKRLAGDPVLLTTWLTRAETLPAEAPVGNLLSPSLRRRGAGSAKVLAICGDGGSGKSTLIDELVRSFLATYPELRVAVLANDPSLQVGSATTAFLADRVRMNAIYHERVWLRSVATGSAYAPISPRLPQLTALFRAAGFGLIIIETPGTGQTGLDLSGLDADLVLYVKTREYGSAFQLQKDQLLRDAGAVVLNKVDLEGAEAGYAELAGVLSELGKKDLLFPTTSKAVNDPGTARLFAWLCERLGWPPPAIPPAGDIFRYAKRSTLVPHRRRAYLAEIAGKVRAYDQMVAGELREIRTNPSGEGLSAETRRLLDEWPSRWNELSLAAAARMGSEPSVQTPNGFQLMRVALPDPDDRAETLRFLLEEGLPGEFPFVTGIYPYRTLSAGETTRQFAGLRGAEETNRRLHFLARGVAKPRLSIAFDGITLYGGDSDDDPGSVGKIGEGGVAIDSWEDMKLVLAGFRIPEISTSMTINGPAAIVLAMYFVAACEIERERAEAERGAPLPASEAEELRRQTVKNLRGTVQADVLKEIQAQNENIFQTDFAIRLLGDVQQWFIENGVDKFYSLSISGYHIGEAGARPVQEIAFTLSNGFTYVENFLARGLPVDSFAPNLSFFFRVSHEAEWLAYGAVCRKIWAIAMRDVYGADARSQRFKFHSQTSGRALQSEEWDTLNPVRQTIHAYLGLLNNTNSLHVDSADEPMTTPAEKWVRQATMIPNYLREEAEAFVIQNLLSGSYAFRTLLREVQAQVLEEFDRLDQLGGVGPATELGYQRRAIAEQSARYEQQRRRPRPEQPEPPLRKIIGYNVFELPEGDPGTYPAASEVVRPGPEDWERQLARVKGFKERHRDEAPLYLERLKQVAREGGNVFGELMETVRHATLGQITAALTEVGGEYRKMV
ncbi:methylmalonyl-CoA mutase family protein [Geomonas sp. Red32]|uniref:methylmalonyl-CoA mutase family protein n=1 Tax=Geomonas sp. Red32 TaxID=2912856 RepID=UPI00202D01DE|nr:methylmalonyl-CoA mutase family protein [Geomonas sp. Red32]MCM0084167.1 methylmalonyl-CoA mutase family protein [Geomonas sp. Red32]